MLGFTARIMELNLHCIIELECYIIYINNKGEFIMLLEEIKIDSEFKDLVSHIKQMTESFTDDDDIELLLSFRKEGGEIKRLINDLEEKGFYIPPMLITTAIIAPELIKFKEKRSNWVLKTDYKMASLLETDKEHHLIDKIFNGLI